MLNRLLPGLIALIGSGLALLLANDSHEKSLAVAKIRFEQFATIIENDLKTDFAFINQEVERAQVFVAGRAGLITAADWQAFSSILNNKNTEDILVATAFIKRVKDEQRPAFEARQRQELETFTISPEGRRSEYYIFTYTGPIQARSSIPYGLDLSQDHIRGTVLEQARDSGSAVMTPALKRLVQAPSEFGLRGQALERLILYAPVYDSVLVPKNVKERRASIKAWVSLVFNPKLLMNSILKDCKNLDVDLFDATGPGMDRELFSIGNDLREEPGLGGDPASKFRRAIPVELGGRNLLLRVHSTLDFERENLGSEESLMLAGMGIALSVVLAVMANLFIRRQTAATELAKSMTVTLIERERMLKEAQAIGHFGNWRYDIVNNKTECCDQTIKMLGMAPGTTVSLKELLRSVHPDDRAGVLTAWNNFIGGISEYNHEYRLRINGQVMWVHSKAVTRRDEQGHSRFVIGTLHDITDTKLMKERIDELLERMTQATTAAGISIWEQDIKTGELIWNDVQYNLYGIEPKKLVGVHEYWWSHVHQDDFVRVVQEYGKLLTKGGSYMTQFRIVRADGCIRRVKACICIKCDANGDPVRAVCANWDITEQCESIETLREAKENAEAANSAKSRFLATMSHELRTPLNAIIGFSDIMLSSEMYEETNKFHNIVLNPARNLFNLIQEVLNFSKIEAGRLTVHSVDFSLENKLDEISKIFDLEACRRGIEFSIKLSPELKMMLRGDDCLLEQVLTNLINNAFKFTEQGRIDVSVAPVAPVPSEGRVMVAFQISDTGIGIKSENLHRIFDISEREDNAMSARFGGTGLGLAITKRMVEILGGEITVESVPNVCSRFSCTIPFELAGEAKVEDHHEVPLSPNPDIKSILIVEDDYFNRELLVRLLGKTGYRVDTAENGEEALSKLADAYFDLVLMDLRMPVMDGVVATQKIRSNSVQGCRKNIPIIIITAHAGLNERRRFLDTGITAYIIKPFDNAALLSIIQRVLTTTANTVPKAEKTLSVSTSTG
ncbi:MAG: CHASE domain-containing protein [Rhodospirillaceae bacterium]